MDWDKEVKLEKLEDMITVYEEHINTLEKENKSLKLQVDSNISQHSVDVLQSNHYSKQFDFLESGHAS